MNGQAGSRNGETRKERAFLGGGRRRISLSTLLTISFVAVVALCAGAIISLTQALTKRVLIDVASADFESAGASTIDNTKYLLEPVAVSLDQVKTVLEETDVLDRQDAVFRHLFDVVFLNSHIYGAYLGLNANGDFLQVQRISASAKVWGPAQQPVPPGSVYVLRKILHQNAHVSEEWRYISDWGHVVHVETVPSPGYDPRGRPFYVSAWASADRVLTDIYMFSSNNKPGITIARRFERAGAPVGVVAADITLESLSNFLRAQPVGEHGVALIVDRSGQVVATPDNADVVPASSKSGPAYIPDMGRPELLDAWDRYRGGAGTRFTFQRPNGEYLAAFHPFPLSFGKEWIIAEVAPVDDFVGALIATMRNVVLLSLAIAVLVALASYAFARGLTKPIAHVIDQADRIRRLDLEDTGRHYSHIDEIQHLLDSMSALKTGIRALANDKIDPSALEELAAFASTDNSHEALLRRVAGVAGNRHAQDIEMGIAAEIQNSILPQTPERRADEVVSIAARMRAAKAVGGDFYDWIWRDGNRLVFFVGDVSGKGVPAAFFMAIARTAMRSSILAGASIDQALFSANNLLVQNNELCFFATVFIGEIDVEASELHYACAGNDPADLLLASGEHRQLIAPGTALGVFEDVEFEEHSIPLSPGDTIIVMTDGVSDAINTSGERFGAGRIETCLAAHALAPGPERDPAVLVQQMIERVDEFAQGEDQFDDITCLALRYNMSVADAG